MVNLKVAYIFLVFTLRHCRHASGQKQKISQKLFFVCSTNMAATPLLTESLGNMRTYNVRTILYTSDKV